MPKTKRDYLKRKIAQAIINMEWAGSYIYEIAVEALQNGHKDLYNDLIDIDFDLSPIIQKTKDIAIEIFGYLPDELDTWIQKGKPRQHPYDEINDITELNEE